MLGGKEGVKKQCKGCQDVFHYRDRPPRALNNAELKAHPDRADAENDGERWQLW